MLSFVKKLSVGYNNVVCTVLHNISNEWSSYWYKVSLNLMSVFWLLAILTDTQWYFVVSLLHFPNSKGDGTWFHMFVICATLLMIYLLVRIGHIF
jgi:hypothetical protein